jgi:hypothetical protein
MVTSFCFAGLVIRLRTWPKYQYRSRKRAFSIEKN